MNSLSQNLEISKNSLALGFELGKIFLEVSELMQQKDKLVQISRSRELEVAHASLLLSCKLIERDVTCPMISNMV